MVVHTFYSSNVNYLPPRIKCIFLWRVKLPFTKEPPTSTPHVLSPVGTAHCTHQSYWLICLFCLQGHSTLQASQDFSTLLTWMAGTNSPRTVNAAATTPRRSKSQIASQVQDGGTKGTKRDWMDAVGRPRPEGCLVRVSPALCSVVCLYW